MPEALHPLGIVGFAGVFVGAFSVEIQDHRLALYAYMKSQSGSRTTANLHIGIWITKPKVPCAQTA